MLNEECPICKEAITDLAEFSDGLAFCGRYCFAFWRDASLAELMSMLPTSVILVKRRDAGKEPPHQWIVGSLGGSWFIDKEGKIFLATHHYREIDSDPKAAIRRYLKTHYRKEIER